MTREAGVEIYERLTRRCKCGGRRQVHVVVLNTFGGDIGKDGAEIKSYVDEWADVAQVLLLLLLLFLFFLLVLCS